MDANIPYELNRFLANLAFFSGIALLFAVAIQALVNWRIKDVNIGGNQTLHAENLNADLVFLGSSRTWAHFDPRFFEKTYGVKSVNIAITGHSEIELATLRLQNYLSKNRPPKFAIFNFDPMASSDSINTKNNFVLKNDFARYAFWPDERDEAIIDFFKFDAVEKYIPAYAILKYKNLKTHLLPKNRSRYDEFGYENNVENWDTVKNPVTGFIKKYYFADSDASEIGRQLAKLDSVCKENKIRLLCIQTPVYKSAYDAHSFSRTKVICKQLGIRYIDMESAVFRNKISYFYNSNHMNRKGVKKMNDLLRTNTELQSFFNVKLAGLKP